MTGNWMAVIAFLCVVILPCVVLGILYLKDYWIAQHTKEENLKKAFCSVDVILANADTRDHMNSIMALARALSRTNSKVEALEERVKVLEPQEDCVWDISPKHDTPWVTMPSAPRSNKPNVNKRNRRKQK